MKRIVIKSNYDDEMFSEKFLIVPPMPEAKARVLCELLNEIEPDGPHYYAPEDPSYKPYKFEP